ncbi:hypothetical protein [Paraburkholderia megapolitana]|uniref:hypothetical protein n=1 Tax=Paraburkholderia megapolitana TaxID=420953 RepID=UPI0038BD4631
MANSQTGPKRIPFAFLAVGIMFSVIGVGLLGAAISIFRHQYRPSTPLMILVGFSWALFAMVISMLLALPGAKASGRTRRRTGTVSTADPYPLPGQTLPGVTGPGVEIESEATLTARSPLPALWLGVASIGLAAVSVLFYVDGRATGLGTLIGLILAFFIMSWATKAWPRARSETQE